MNDIDIKALVGKTIKAVTVRKTWNDREDEAIEFVFTDGTRMNVSASTQSGCNECNYDGRNIDYLNIYF
jgi:hypothetical protein